MQQDGKPIILVISDNGKALLEVARLIAQLIPHHLVRVCSESAHALNYISYTPVKGIILRYEQAPLDGIVLANRLLERQANIPILLLCDRPSSHFIDAAYSAGCYVVIDTTTDLQAIVQSLFAEPWYIN